MNKCTKCCCKIVKHLWLVDGIVYCSPFCERSSWDARGRKINTKSHPHGDYKVDKFGLAGLKREKRTFDWTREH